MIIDDTCQLSKYFPLADNPKIQGILNDAANMPVGEYVINEKVLVKRLSVMTSFFGDSIIEAHRHHVDIQIPLDKAEYMNIYSITGAEPKSNYDPEKDVTLFNLPPNLIAKTVIRPGQFIFIEPNEIHQPQLATDQVESMEKIVIKIDIS